ncbi:MAG: hypothetical protein HFJ09_06225 [Lachnospiraceae bacterium]|nr:hypothetical protein [Lachnospiraceae bacterium]
MIFSRTKFICVLFLFSILLTGCGENKDAMEKVQEKEKIQDVDYCDEVSIKENEKIVYNIYKEKLGIYNKQDYSWHVLYEEEEEFAYKINGRSDIYTVGNTSYNHFSIMKNAESGLYKILDIDEKDSIMPFGEYKDEYYFIYNIDDLGGKIQRKIVKYNNKKLTDVLDLDSQLVASAVVVKDNIYYASYQKDKDYYELYQYNLKNADVQLILKDLPTDSLYNLNGNLVWNDGQGNILDRKGKVWCKVEEESDVDYNSEYKLFFCVYPNKKNALVCDVIHAENGKILVKAENFIGYEIDGITLSLFCDDGIQNINLKKGK